MQHECLKSLTSEATPSATQFFNGLTKLAILPDYKHHGLLCIALPPRQKSGLILVKKLPKIHFNKKCAPKFLFFSMKKKSERLG